MWLNKVGSRDIAPLAVTLATRPLISTIACPANVRLSPLLIKDNDTLTPHHIHLSAYCTRPIPDLSKNRSCNSQPVTRKLATLVRDSDSLRDSHSQKPPPHPYSRNSYSSPAYNPPYWPNPSTHSPTSPHPATYPNRSASARSCLCRIASCFWWVGRSGFGGGGVRLVERQ